jgi:SOS-response transcriptional repressor LexA
MSRRNEIFISVKTEGAVLPADLLKKISEGSRDLEGLEPEAYHLPDNERISTAVSRSWTRLRAAWAGFKAAKAGLGPEDYGTAITREKWLLHLFQALDYGRLQAAKGLKTEEKEYPISHIWRAIPIHLVGFGVDLDHRQKGVAGAAKISPHGLLQDYLNQEEAAIWGMLSNGLKFRLLRDNVSLTRQAYVEFDLEAMFEGDLYSDFHLLWMLCHQSRFESEKPEDCWLERWSVQARAQGIRVMDSLRSGVEEALKVLGKGFISHSSNAELRQKLKNGLLSPQNYYRQLLRMVYRLLFLFVAEDRRLLLDPQASEAAKSTYYRFYSASRLRYMAGSIPGSKHGDLYRSLVLLMGLLHEKGNNELGLPALNSFLWSIEAVKDLCECEISNRDLLKAIRCIAYTQKEKYLSNVDFRNLGSEELGSIYESLLELHPKIVADVWDFQLFSAQGNERKSTGSYYTPTSLIKVLLQTALDPVLEHAANQNNPEEAILNLKICDPACGSGHFLVAAAHRVARRLAMVRTGDDEPSPEAVRHALRDVVGHCLYGVDRNEMAVELCKVSLWMEGMEPGKPLSFLEHRIQYGNSLIGATPVLIAGGIPNEAFIALEGDDKKVVSSLKQRNKQEREGQIILDFNAENKTEQAALADSMAAINAVTDDSLETIQEKQKRFIAFSKSQAYKHAKAIADAWCSAFLIEKNVATQAECFTQDSFLKLQSDDRNIENAPAQTAARLADEYQLLHWHLAFPDVFKASSEPTSASKSGWLGGFDVVLGNPPWDVLQPEETKFFLKNEPDILEARTASSRKKLIAQLEHKNAWVFSEWITHCQRVEREKQFIAVSGRFPLTCYGKINLYSSFAELSRQLISGDGCIGIVLPTGIATDEPNRWFIGDLVTNGDIRSFIDFENRKGIFPAIDSRTRFCLLSLGRGKYHPDKSLFVYFATDPIEINDIEKRIELTKEDVNLINPNTKTLPIFRNRFDYEITSTVMKKTRVLFEEGQPSRDPWGFRMIRMYMMDSDSHRFTPLGAENLKQMVPLYEAKNIHQYDHRHSTFEGTSLEEQKKGNPRELDKKDKETEIQTRFYLSASDYRSKVENRFSSKKYLLGIRDITNATNERSVIASVIPIVAAANSLPLMLTNQDAQLEACLLANLNSIVVDYFARQKIGGLHLNFYIVAQLPILEPNVFWERCAWNKQVILKDWILERVINLSYTSQSIKGFAESCGFKGEPFETRAVEREVLKAELDACFFHLYDLERKEVSYILDTFSVLKRKEEAKNGEYRTKNLVLKYFDAMAGDQPIAELINLPKEPFKRVRPKNSQRYENCVPIWSLKAAAGGFSSSQEVEQLEEWAEIENSRKLRQGMFTAQVVGKSMEPTIPDGSWCLFSYPAAGSRDGRILLVQHHDIHDPETGGSYTIKRYKSTKVADDEGGWRHSEIRLEPDNKEYQPIILKDADEGEVEVLADFLEVISELKR